MDINLSDLVALKMGLLRNARDSRLVEADNLVNVALDNGVDVTPFRQYRQALRDTPQAYNNLDDVVWPTKPQLSQS